VEVVILFLGVAFVWFCIAGATNAIHRFTQKAERTLKVRYLQDRRISRRSKNIARVCYWVYKITAWTMRYLMMLSVGACLAFVAIGIIVAAMVIGVAVMNSQLFIVAD